MSDELEMNPVDRVQRVVAIIMEEVEKLKPDDSPAGKGAQILLMNLVSIAVSTMAGDRELLGNVLESMK